MASFSSSLYSHVIEAHQGPSQAPRVAKVMLSKVGSREPPSAANQSGRFACLIKVICGQIWA